MRLPVLSLLLLTIALIGGSNTTYAQSPESYPWCAIYGMGDGSGGAQSCYYTSWEQCMTTMSGIGGLCVQSPYYHPQPAPRPAHAAKKRSRVHRPV
jgi:hypothetical protein